MSGFPYFVVFIIPSEVQTYQPVTHGDVEHMYNLMLAWGKLLIDNDLGQYVWNTDHYTFRNMEDCSLGGTKLFVYLSNELGSRMMTLGGVARLGTFMIHVDVEAVART